MNGELQALRALARCLPPVPGARIVGNLIRDFYARHERQRVVVRVRGVLMDLEPSENVDGSLLFCPHLYDRRELAALLPLLARGGVFVDVGSHLGLYALLAATRVAPGGRVLAVEADPRNYERVLDNLRRNPELAIETACVAVSDVDGKTRLAQNVTGNRGGNSLLEAGDEAIEVPCRPLAAVLAERGIDRVAGLRLDLAGMEFRVLARYFEDVPPLARPRVIVYAHRPGRIDEAGGDASRLLRDAGYREVVATRLNRVVARD